MALMSGIMVSFEKVIREWVAKNYGEVNMSKPQYSITRVGMGQYDIKLSLSGLGEQHIGIAIINDEIVIRGKIALIGENPSFPINLIQELVNSAIQTWIKNGLDSLATQPNNAIKIADAGFQSILHAPLPTGLA